MYHVRNLIVEYNPASANNPLFVFSSFGEHGVDVFFVISGYCIAQASISAIEKPSGAAGFIIARVRRIFPPYIAATTMAIALLLATRLTFAHAPHISDLPADYTRAHSALYYFANLTLTQKLFHQGFAVKQGWTLCYEAFFYFLFGILVWIAVKTGRDRTLLTLSHILTVLILISLIVEPSRIAYPFDLLPIFGIGVCVYDILKHRENLLPCCWFSLISVITLAVTWCAMSNHLGGTNPFNGQPEAYCYTVGVIVSLLLLAFHRFDARLISSPVVRPIAAVGPFSYSLYLSHGFTIYLLHLTLGAFRLNQYIVYIIAVSVSILAGRIFFQFFERPFLSTYRKRIIVEERHPEASLIADG
jgi:peptidoglycan/LPS O-acetylase OafA/YrhL